MKIIKRLIAVVATFQFLVSTPVYQAFAKGSAIESHSLITTDDNALEIGLSYLDNTQDEYGAWGEFGKIQTADITNILEYIRNDDQSETVISNLIVNAADYLWIERDYNVDDSSKYLLIDEFQDAWEVSGFIEYQNANGGFGLDKGYTSDIIDTKLALKMLADLGETEAMTNAAM